MAKKKDCQICHNPTGAQLCSNDLLLQQPSDAARTCIFSRLLGNTSSCSGLPAIEPLSAAGLACLTLLAGNYVLSSWQTELFPEVQGHDMGISSA